MKAPEKVYIDDFGSGFSHGWHTEHSYERDIEYVRNDAFIEKACDAYCRLCDTKECGDTGECELVEKFRKRLMRQQWKRKN